MPNDFRNQSGSIAIIFSAGTALLFAAIISLQYSQQYIANRALVHLLNQEENYYSGEMGALYLLSQTPNNPTGPVTFNIVNTPYSGSGTPLQYLPANYTSGSALPLENTIDFAPNNYLIRRYNGNNYHYEYNQVGGTATACSWLDIPSSQKLRRTCLALPGNNCTSASVFTTGSGTAASPYQICSLAHLNEMRNNTSAYYKITKDIDASSTASNSWIPLPRSFSAHLDGNNHVISKLTINRPSDTSVGLFAGIDNGGQVSNLTLKDITVTGNLEVGGLAGRITSASVVALSNIRVNGSITATGANSTAGLIVGIAQYIQLNNCILSGQVTGTRNVGLVAGKIIESKVTNCSANGSLVATSTTGVTVGGLMGTGEGVQISKSSASGTISANGTTGGSLGGLVGQAHFGITAAYPCSLTDTFSNFDISITSNGGGASSNIQAGGLVGLSTSSGTLVCKIHNSFATSNISTSGNATNQTAGTIIGIQNTGEISNSFGTGTLTLPSCANCFVGGITGTLIVPSGSPSQPYVNNSFWLKRTGGPTVCIKSGIASNSGSCNSIASESLFYSSSTAPTNTLFSTWDTSTIWSFSGSGLPLLK